MSENRLNCCLFSIYIRFST